MKAEPLAEPKDGFYGYSRKAMNLFSFWSKKGQTEPLNPLDPIVEDLAVVYITVSHT